MVSSGKFENYFGTEFLGPGSFSKIFKLFYAIGLYARYLCSRDALGLKAEQPLGQARATIGYLVYKPLVTLENTDYVASVPLLLLIIDTNAIISGRSIKIVILIFYWRQ